MIWAHKTVGLRDYRDMYKHSTFKSLWLQFETSKQEKNVQKSQNWVSEEQESAPGSSSDFNYSFIEKFKIHSVRPVGLLAVLEAWTWIRFPQVNGSAKEVA